MAKKTMAFGKGLSAMLEDAAAVQFNRPQAAPVKDNPEASAAAVAEIPLDKIIPNPYQPRLTFDEDALQELSDSIKVLGIIQPLTLRLMPDGRYQIISGERRTRASRLAGCTAIKAQVYENLDDKDMSEWALIENIQRVDLNPIEVAQSYQQLIDNHNYTHEDLAKTVGKSRSAITNALRLLKLPNQVQAWIQEGKISGGAARALCSDKIQNPEEIARRIIEEGLNVRQIEAISRGESIEPATPAAETPAPAVETTPAAEAGTAPDPQTKPKVELSADMKQFESRLETFFGTKVALKPSGTKESEGTIVINYYSMDDLNRIQELMENR